MTRSISHQAVQQHDTGGHGENGSALVATLERVKQQQPADGQAFQELKDLNKKFHGCCAVYFHFEEVEKEYQRFKNELDALETEEQALPEHGRVWDNLEHRKAAIVAQKNQAATKLHPISAERNRLIARIREFEKMAARDHGGLIETVKASCLRLEQAEEQLDSYSARVEHLVRLFNANDPNTVASFGQKNLAKAHRAQIELPLGEETGEALLESVEKLKEAYARGMSLEADGSYRRVLAVNKKYGFCYNVYTKLNKIEEQLKERDAEANRLEDERKMLVAARQSNDDEQMRRLEARQVTVADEIGLLHVYLDTFLTRKREAEAIYAECGRSSDERDETLGELCDRLSDHVAEIVREHY
ncbi:hypothetical protein JCM3766R1_000680 [Sporobolomyces carnicolor]